MEDDDKVSNKMGQFGGGLHAYFFDMQLMWTSDSSDQKIKFSMILLSSYPDSDGWREAGPQ